MKKYLVLYMMPVAGLDEWMQKPEAERKPEEERLQKKWQEWAKVNGGNIKDTGGAGKAQRVTQGAVESTKNAIMLYSILEADSDDAAAKLLEGHPHLEIPGSWIEVMPMNPLPGMQA